MYSNCNSRGVCSSKNLLSTAPGPFAYRTQLNSELHPGAICAGSGAGLGRSCSSYGASRRTVGGVDGIRDPTLIQRSYFSSGCPPNKFTNMEDTLSDPVNWANPEGIALNKGASMSSFHTRNFQTNYTSVNENPRFVDRALQIGSSWTSGYAGLSAVGGNIPERMVASYKVNGKYRKYENEPISRLSYASYGVAG
jgi:hypothetical protein